MSATGALLLTKRTEKKELAYSGMISGEEPPYRPLSTEKIDIARGAYRS